MSWLDGFIDGWGLCFLKRGLAFDRGEFLKLAVVAVDFLLDGIENETVFLYCQVVVVNFVFDGLLEFLKFIFSQPEVKIGDGHGEGCVSEDEELIDLLFCQGL